MVNIQIIEQEIHLRQLKLANLYKRLFYIYHNNANKSEYEKNEVEITRINTLFEIRKERSILNKRKELYQREFNEKIIANDSVGANNS